MLVNGGLDLISTHGERLNNYVTNKIQVPEPENNVWLDIHLKYTDPVNLHMQKECRNNISFSEADLEKGDSLSRKYGTLEYLGLKKKKDVIHNIDHAEPFNFDTEEPLLDQTQNFISRGLTYEEMLNGMSMSKNGYHVNFKVDKNNELIKEDGVNDQLKGGSFIEAPKDVLLSNYGVNENGDSLLTSGVKNYVI